MWTKSGRLEASSLGLTPQQRRHGEASGTRTCFQVCPRLDVWKLLSIQYMHAQRVAPPSLISDSDGEQTVQTRPTTEVGRGKPKAKTGSGPLLPGSRPGADPVDLLDRHASRQLVQATAGKSRRRDHGEDAIEFETNASGQMVIKVS